MMYKTFPKINIPKADALSFKQMKTLDYYSVDKYQLPIELMMENAGFHLASIIAAYSQKDAQILIGVGPGNNGGGGLVAARRLAAWGFSVFLDIPNQELATLPAKQLERAMLFGVSQNKISNPDIFVDAYLGFSQRFPLLEIYQESIKLANNLDTLRISLDVPTGLSENEGIMSEFMQANVIVSLAAPKKVLYRPELKSDIYLVDLGLPQIVYAEFKHSFNIPFHQSAIWQLQCTLD